MSPRSRTARRDEGAGTTSTTPSSQPAPAERAVDATRRAGARGRPRGRAGRRPSTPTRRPGAGRRRHPRRAPAACRPATGAARPRARRRARHRRRPVHRRRRRPGPRQAPGRRREGQPQQRPVAPRAPVGTRAEASTALTGQDEVDEVAAPQPRQDPADDAPAVTTPPRIGRSDPAAPSHETSRPHRTWRRETVRRVWGRRRVAAGGCGNGAEPLPGPGPRPLPWRPASAAGDEHVTAPLDLRPVGAGPGEHPVVARDDDEAAGSADGRDAHGAGDGAQTRPSPDGSRRRPHRSCASQARTASPRAHLAEDGVARPGRAT